MNKSYNKEWHSNPSEGTEGVSIFYTGIGLKERIQELIEQGVVPLDRQQDDIPFYDIVNSLKDYGSEQFSWLQWPPKVRNNIKQAYMEASTAYKIASNALPNT